MQTHISTVLKVVLVPWIKKALNSRFEVDYSQAGQPKTQGSEATCPLQEPCSPVI